MWILFEYRFIGEEFDIQYSWRFFYFFWNVQLSNNFYLSVFKRMRLNTSFRFWRFNRKMNVSKIDIAIYKSKSPYLKHWVSLTYRAWDIPMAWDHPSQIAICQTYANPANVLKHTLHSKWHEREAEYKWGANFWMNALE